MNVKPTIPHLLLVEDNPDHAELIRRQLERLPAGVRLHHVEDGEAALDYIFGKNDYADRQRFPAPELVLLDLRLPRVDGLEVLRLVKSQAQFQQLPVVVLTSSDAENDVARSFELQADGFLTKPIELDTLQKILCGLGLGGGLGQPKVFLRPNLNCPP
jgi:CheY-like chemotaxis protein